VNPHERTVLGQRAYARITDVPEHLDIVDVFRRPEETPQIAVDAVAIQAGMLWLQQGVWNEEAAARARAAGLPVAMDLCIAVEYARLGIGLPRAAL
ncbi:MAG TPA: CoA-binding protein, partial [Gemmatimonadaceae bacterium]|nr:CoA-binding protein [Gemmatimonadaceae bacterium]